MRKLFLVLLMLTSSLSFSQEESKTTYFLIRHAEKDRSDQENKNPELTEKGKQRAVKWSSLLADYGIDAIYSTDYNRTRQTAQPTADKLELEIITYHPFKIDFDGFLKETKGKSVLVVGHSNTIPFFTNKLIGKDKYKQLEDNDNASLFIVTINQEDIDHVVIKTKD